MTSPRLLNNPVCPRLESMGNRSGRVAKMHGRSADLRYKQKINDLSNGMHSVGFGISRWARGVGDRRCLAP